MRGIVQKYQMKKQESGITITINVMKGKRLVNQTKCKHIEKNIMKIDCRWTISQTIFLDLKRTFKNILR